MYFPTLLHLYFQTLHAWSHRGDCWMETPGRGCQPGLSVEDLRDFPESRLSWTQNVTPWSQSPASVTCRPRRPRGCGPRGRGGPRGPGEAAARSRRSGRPPGGCSLTARGVRWSQQSRGSLWPALCIPALNRVFCMELILIFVLFHFFAIYLEEFCTVRFYGSRHDCWRCHAGTALWSPERVKIFAKCYSIFWDDAPCNVQAPSTSLWSSLCSPESQVLAWWEYPLSPWRMEDHTDNMFNNHIHFTHKLIIKITIHL